MKKQELLEILAAGGVATVPRGRWSGVGRGFEELEVHDTGLAGKLRVGQLGDHLVAVEEAEPGKLAVRPFKSRTAATRFVKQRLEAYERLWDG